MRGVIRSYRRTLSADRRQLLERYRYVHSARKVVGVGSVGTRAWIVLMLGRDEDDPLFLQLKEAEASVLEPFLGKSAFDNHGQRVVEGQRLMQAASDIMLGWMRVTLRRREPGLLHAPALGREGLGAGRGDEPEGDDGLRASCAGGRSPRRTPAPATRSRSQAISAQATASIARWPRSRRPTPTRTSATTTLCVRPSRPAASRPRRPLTGLGSGIRQPGSTIVLLAADMPEEKFKKETLELINAMYPNKKPPPGRFSRSSNDAATASVSRGRYLDPLADHVRLPGLSF